MTTPNSRIESFYGRWVGVYDILATAIAPTAWRARAVDALELSRGDTVVELGCGTGANFPLLRKRVGPSGRVVGVDLTPAMLQRARRRVERAGWDNITLLRGDAGQPPISDANAVLGTFVVGLLSDPAAAVETWCTLATDRIALLDGASSAHPIGRLCNPLFGAFVAAGTPADSVRETVRRIITCDDARQRLDDAVRRSRNALRDHTTNHRMETFAMGFLGLMSGTPVRS
ncbi:class I SAM-dependent methyltransferase [Halocatena salina]|uniref:Methyltransferase domain-containing protein n=1 Tax=Halocatena salina TaxID=2934340 RepID=A0A8U0A4Q3_9EURY|nr:methyltransferase domain-containing protein [Halocatena salina]UPM44014.1 methyltransferase domain-containing protein [Halocatena salina]